LLRAEISRLKAATGNDKPKRDTRQKKVDFVPGMAGEDWDDEDL
jgi:hypothetical protein